MDIRDPIQRKTYPADVGNGDRSGLTNHGVEGKGNHDTDGDTLGTSASVKDLGRNDPRQRTTGGGETDVVQPGHDDKGPTGSTVAGSSWWEHCQEDGSEDEEETVEEVATDQSPSATGPVNEPDTSGLGKKSEDRADTLVLERVGRGDTNLLEDGDTVVLDCRNTSHLHGSLNGADEHQATQRRPVGEELLVRLGLVLVFVGDGILDLLELGAHPWIVLVTVGVQSRECGQTLLLVTVVDEPTRRLGEKQNQSSKDDSWDDLQTEREPPLDGIARAEVLCGSVGGPRRDESADTKHELLESSDTTTNARVSELGLVERNDHDEETDTAQCVLVLDVMLYGSEEALLLTRIQRYNDQRRDSPGSGRQSAAHHPE